MVSGVLKKRKRLYPGVILALGLVLAFSSPPAYAKPEVVDPRFDYAEMFRLTREVMTRAPARKVLDQLFANQLRVNAELAAKYGYKKQKIAGFTETQMMLLLQEVPSLRAEIQEYISAVPRTTSAVETPEIQALREKWRKKFTEIFENKTLLDNFFKRNNPFDPFLLEMPPGKKGFGRFDTYLTFPTRHKGAFRPADNAEKAIVDFINSAEHEIRFNVFDFDLHSIADALIAAKKRGVDVMGGIDAGVIETRPEVKAVYEKLLASGMHVQAVDSVGLNHQKLITADWSYPGKAKVVQSTGNFTQSCLSPGGDMTGTAFHSEKSIANANMVKIVQSDELALVVHHEITKTVDPKFALKGKQYPISGAYEITGEELVKGTKRWMVMAFTPNGGLGNINENLIGRVIMTYPGPHYTAQFAWSSKETGQALLEKARIAVKENKPFVLKAVGDTPFAMQDWSIFQWIAGLKLVQDGEKKGYVIVPDAENEWLQVLGEERYKKVLADLKIAPLRYGNFVVQTPDGGFKITSKLHLKMFVQGEGENLVGIFGSFNFSAGAENNQEYITVIADPESNELMRSIVETFSEESKLTIREEAEARNLRRQFDPPEGEEVDAPKAGRSAKNVKVNCKKLLRKPTVGIHKP